MGVAPDRTVKQRQLRALNHEAQSLQTALNQSQGSISHALRLLEQTYQRKRTQILNNRGEDRDEP
jgi:hypothetical protein